LKIRLPYIVFFISILFTTVLWDFISLPFNSEIDINSGSYYDNNHHPQNDLLRFIIFLSLPFLTLIYCLESTSNFFLKNSNEIIFNYQNNKIKFDKKLSNIFYILVLAVILEFFFLDFENITHQIDIFHEGLWLTASQNSNITKNFWQSSYIGRGFFGNFHPYFLWKFIGFDSIGITRFFNLLIILLNKILLLVIALRLTNSSNLEIDDKIKFYLLLSLTFLSFTSYGDPIFFIRSFLLLVFIVLLLNYFILKEYKVYYLIPIGLLSSFSMLWYIDIGIYINSIILFLSFFLILRLEFKNFLILLAFIILGWFLTYLSFSKAELIQFTENTILIFSTLEYIHGLIFPTPFLSLDARSTKTLILFLATGFFIIMGINKVSKNQQIFFMTLCILFTISIIYFKYGLSRSDSGHIRIASGFLYLAFFPIIYFNILKYLSRSQNVILNTLKNNINYILILILVTSLIFNKKYENKNIYNLVKSKNSIIKLINYSDEKFISKDYIDLLNYYSVLTKEDKCVMIFTNEVAIPYFLKKNSCSKYYLMFTAEPLKIQKEIVQDLDKSDLSFIIYKSDIDNYGDNGKKLDFVNKYIQAKYEFFEKFNHWQIYKKK
jgi:hypothetical protein